MRGALLRDRGAGRALTTRWGLVSLVALAAMGLSGCLWPAMGAGPSRTSHNALEDQITSATVGDLQEVWVATLPGGVGAPVTSTAGVHAVAGGDTLVGVDRGTGEQLWANAVTEDFLTMSPPIFGADRVWMTEGRALNWGFSTQLVDPATGEAIQAGPADGEVHGLRGTSFVTRWGSFDPSTGFGEVGMTVGDLDDPDAGWRGSYSPRQVGDPGHSRLTLGEDLIYQAGHGLNDERTQEMGNAIRGYRLAPRPDCQSWDSVVCPTWVRRLDGSEATDPVLGADAVFTVTDVGTVYAVSATDGTPLWSTALDVPVTQTPALADGSLHVPTTDGRLVVLDSSTGAQRWEADLGSEPTVQPALAGGVVYVGTAGGTVAGYDAAGCGAATCEPIWTSDLGSRISGAPAVSAGQLYVGTSDGRLVAYGVPGSA